MCSVLHTCYEPFLNHVWTLDGVLVGIWFGFYSVNTVCVQGLVVLGPLKVKVKVEVVVGGRIAKWIGWDFDL